MRACYIVQSALPVLLIVITLLIATDNTDISDANNNTGVISLDSLTLEIHAESIRLSYDSTSNRVCVESYEREARSTIEFLYIGGIVDRKDIYYMSNMLKVAGIINVMVDAEELDKYIQEHKDL